MVRPLLFLIPQSIDRHPDSRTTFHSWSVVIVWVAEVFQMDICEQFNFFGKFDLNATSGNHFGSDFRSPIRTAKVPVMVVIAANSDVSYQGYADISFRKQEKWCVTDANERISRLQEGKISRSPVF